MTTLQTLERFADILAYGLPIGRFGFRHRRSQQCQRWIHHGKVDDVPIENAVVVPAIRIREQLAGRHVQGRERCNITNLIADPRRREFNPPFKNDFKFDALVCHLQHGPDAILIGPYLAGLCQWPSALAGNRGDSIRACEQLAQVAVAGNIRYQKIDVDRLAVFAISKRNDGAAAKQAVVLP